MHRLLLASLVIALAADVSAQRRSGLDAQYRPFKFRQAFLPVISKK